MKTQFRSARVPFLHARKSLCSRFCSLAAFAAGLALLGGQSQVAAQTDDFNDMSDAAPVAWMHYDSIDLLSPLPAQNTWTTDGSTYRLQALPVGAAVGTVGPARVGSFPPDVYSDFYVSVDITAWDNTYSQAMGILARTSGFGGALKGYVFAYVNGSVSYPSAPYNVDFIAIARVRNEVGTSGVPGTSSLSGVDSGNCEALFHLDPLTQYRLVFIGKGNHLEGRVYELPDVTTPKIILQADVTTDNDPILTSGQIGLLGNNYATSAGAAGQGPVDVTFDNYSASGTCPSIRDDFNDGDDTAPAPAWEHHDSIAEAGVPPACYAGATFTFPSGGYRLFSPRPCITAAAGPRVNALKPGIWTDFYVSVDVIDWDATLHTLFGIAARINTPGPGTTGGYLFTWENGDGTPTDGDFDVLRIQGEGGAEAHQMEGDVPGQDSELHLTTGKSYRFVLIGKGANFEARVYELPNTSTPIKTLLAVDNTPGGPKFPSGQLGLIVVDHPAEDGSPGNPYHACSATFDNFVADTTEPKLKITVDPFLVAAVSWPGTLGCPSRLESSSDLVVWTAIPLTEIKYTEVAITDVAGAGERYYKVPGTIDQAGTAFYRLK